MKRLLLTLAVLAPSATRAEDKCTFGISGDLDLVSSSITSTVEIRGTAECIKKLGKQVTLAATGQGSIVAEVKPDSDTAKLIVRDVPALTAGNVEWHITPTGQSADIGTVSLKSTSISVKQLVVTYGDRRLDSQQGGVAAKNDDGFIAVSQYRNPHDPVDFNDIMNTAQLDVSPRLLHRPTSHWEIGPSSWGTSVEFQFADKPDRFDISRIRFGVVRRLKSPLQARLRLVDNTSKQALVDAYVTLASEARPESIPLPLTDALAIKCSAWRWLGNDPTTKANDGGTLAIDDDAFERKRCKLHVDYGKAPRNLYGDQALEITVSRGAKKGTTVVVASAREPAPFDIPLVAPAGAGDESGAYHVAVRLVSGKKDVIYREGSLPAADTLDTRLTFDVTLRPRGKLGLTYPVRLYVTFPVSPVSLRFPARASDLQSSDDTPVVQSTSRAGAMFVVEPWDYDLDRNQFRIPLSFQVGISSTSTDNILNNSSLMMGVSLDFPIIDKSFTETSIALGFFYEIGLEDPRSEAHRAFVITAGLDLFRALKTNKSSEKTE